MADVEKTTGSPNTFDMNAQKRSPQPIFDKYRAENKFERHPPKTNKTITAMKSNDPNVIGQANLKRQQDIAGELSNDSVDGL